LPQTPPENFFEKKFSGLSKNFIKGVINRLFSLIADGMVLPDAFRDHDPDRAAGRARPWSFAPNLTRKTFEKVFLDFSKLSTHFSEGGMRYLIFLR